LSSPPHSPLVSREPAMGEQRLYLRKKVPMPLPVELLPGKEVWLNDLGEGGLGVSGSSRLELGTSTFFSFQFPDPNSVIEAAGVVAWCDLAGRAGVRFTRIKPDSSAVLKRWLKTEPVSGSTASPTASNSAAAVQPPRGRHETADLREEILAANLDTRAALDVLADRLVRLTRAAGAAIAWSDADNVICQASSGNAPSVGTKLDADSSITGECYRTGNIVSISYSEKDLRLDAELCRELDLRSLLIVPVTTRDEVIGVVEVFSPVAGNFDGGDILLLGSVAEIIAELYNQQHTPTPAVTVAFDIPIREHSEDASEQEISSIELGFETEPAQARTQVLDNGAAQQPPSPDDSAPQDAAADSSNSSIGKSRLYLLGIALLITAGMGLGDYFDWHFGRSWITSQLSVHAAVPASTPAIAEPSSSAVVPQEELPSAELQATTPTQTSSLAKPIVARKSELPLQPLDANLVKGETSRLAEAEPEPTPPAIRVLRSFDLPITPSYPRLAKSVATKPDQHVSPTQLIPAKLIHRVEPNFPEFARTGGIAGPILLSAIIGKDGRLKNIRLVSGNNALALEAFRAMREWRYKPYLLDGKPIEAETRIVIDFHR
jgi:outer membrane biosynthesis protein TonB